MRKWKKTEPLYEAERICRGSDEIYKESEGAEYGISV